MKIIFSLWAKSVQLAQSMKQTSPLLFSSLPPRPSRPRTSGVSFPQFPLPHVRCCAVGIPPLPRGSVACRYCCSAPSHAHISSCCLVPSHGQAVIMPRAERSMTSRAQCSHWRLLRCRARASEPSARTRVGRLLACRVARASHRVATSAQLFPSCSAWTTTSSQSA
jgi:hypothetical protein